MSFYQVKIQLKGTSYRLNTCPHQSSNCSHLDLGLSRLQNSEEYISSALNHLICILIAAALVAPQCLRSHLRSYLFKQFTDEYR